MFGHSPKESSDKNTDTQFAVVYLKDLKKQFELAESPESVTKMLKLFMESTNLHIHDEEIQNKKHILQQEACIMAFSRISVLKKGIRELDDADMENVNTCCLVNSNDYGDRYFFAIDANHIDRSISKYFKDGTRFTYLLENKYHAEMMHILLGWVAAGLLDGKTKHPALQAMCDKWKQCQLEFDKSLEHELNMMAIDKKNILNFVTENIMNEGWKPWFQLVNVNNEKLALISLACKEQGVNLRMYSQDSSGKLIQNNFGSNTADDVEDANNPPLHVLYNEVSDQLIILDEITKPSHLYRRMAVRICCDVLQEDPLNACALELAGEKGVAALPQIARTALSMDNLNKSTSQQFIQALDQFAANHNCNVDEKQKAKSVRDAHQCKMDGSFFTRKKAAAVAVSAVAATIGLAYFSKDN